jgi:hypothetical protein
MLNQVYDELSTKVFQTGGDSMDSAERNQFEKFLGDMKAVRSAFLFRKSRLTLVPFPG